MYQQAGVPPSGYYSNYGFQQPAQLDAWGTAIPGPPSVLPPAVPPPSAPPASNNLPPVWHKAAPAQPPVAPVPPAVELQAQPPPPVPMPPPSLLVPPAGLTMPQAPLSDPEAIAAALRSQLLNVTGKPDSELMAALQRAAQMPSPQPEAQGEVPPPPPGPPPEEVPTASEARGANGGCIVPDSNTGEAKFDGAGHPPDAPESTTSRAGDVKEEASKADTAIAGHDDAGKVAGTNGKTDQMPEGGPDHVPGTSQDETDQRPPETSAAPQASMTSQVRGQEGHASGSLQPGVAGDAVPRASPLVSVMATISELQNGHGQLPGLGAELSNDALAAAEAAARHACSSAVPEAEVKVIAAAAARAAVQVMSKQNKLQASTGEQQQIASNMDEHKAFAGPAALDRVNGAAPAAHAIAPAPPALAEQTYRYNMGPHDDVEGCFRNLRRRIEVELEDGCTIQMCLQVAG